MATKLLLKIKSNGPSNSANITDVFGLESENVTIEKISIFIEIGVFQENFLNKVAFRIFGLDFSIDLDNLRTVDIRPSLSRFRYPFQI